MSAGLVQPTTVGDCQSCCSQLFEEEALQACQVDGCIVASRCEQDETEFRNACDTGGQFRMSGLGLVDSEEVATCRAGELTIFEGSSNVTNQAISRQECESCCDDYDERDTDRVFDKATCEENCLTPVECFSGPTSARFVNSCLVALDLLTIGESLFNDSKRLLTCVDGSIVETILTEEEEVVPEKDEQDTNSSMLFGVVGAAAGLLALFLVLVLISRRKRLSHSFDRFKLDIVGLSGRKCKLRKGPSGIPITMQVPQLPLDTEKSVTFAPNEQLDAFGNPTEASFAYGSFETVSTVPINIGPNISAKRLEEVSF